MSSRRGLPEFRKMRHDRHFVEELANHSTTGVGMMVPVERIETNREQPRMSLGDLAELAASIRTHGVLEPLLVRRLPDSRSFQLIAGERRFQAALQVGLHEVPCIEMEVSDQEALELALIENLQRKDLSPFEEAEGYRTLVEKYAYSHEQVAEALGKSRTTVTEALKLLEMPPAIRDLCRHADITAKSVLLLVARAGSIPEMERLVQEIAEQGLDREGARFSSRQGHADHEASTGGHAAEQAPGEADSPAGAFKPLRIRFRSSADAPVHLSVSIRQPNISRDEIIKTLESLIARIRQGELDAQLTRAGAAE